MPTTTSPSSPSSCSSSSSTSSTSSSSCCSEPSHPIQIGFTPAGSDALLDIFHAPSSLSTDSSACAFPSWPKHDSLHSTSRATRGAAYLSDEDLFGDLDGLSLNDGPYLCEAPAPPRPSRDWTSRPPQPLPLSVKTKSKRASKKVRRVSKPMTPIPESPV